MVAHWISSVANRLGGEVGRRPMHIDNGVRKALVSRGRGKRSRDGQSKTLIGGSGVGLLSSPPAIMRLQSLGLE
jgi:hypothetical protein